MLLQGCPRPPIRDGIVTPPYCYREERRGEVFFFNRLLDVNANDDTLINFVCLSADRTILSKTHGTMLKKYNTWSRLMGRRNNNVYKFISNACLGLIEFLKNKKKQTSNSHTVYDRNLN